MKVWIDEGCIACRVCEELCPDVFVVDENASVVEENIPEYEEAVLEAAEDCPVECIVIEADDEDDLIEDSDEVHIDEDEL